MKKVLIDSDAYTYFLQGNNKVQHELEKADKVYFSVIVLGELLAAFKKGTREKENSKILNKFLSKITVEIILVTRETAEVYSSTKKLLQDVGKPIPSNDLWIASQAIETGSILITFDKHFLHIPGLRLWNKI